MAESKTLKVACQACGTTNTIDADALAESGGITLCTSCGNLIQTEASDAPAAAASAPDIAPEAAPAPSPGMDESRPSAGMGRRMGLRGKMAVLFLAVPLVLMTVAGIFYVWQLNRMVSIVKHTSTDMVTRISGELMAQYSRQAAIQVRRYLADHQFVKKEDFNEKEHEFKLLAVQKVGLTGFTCLYALPDAGNVWRMWAHVDPDLVGVDLAAEMKKVLGAGFDDYWKIVSAVATGKSARGSYSWTDKDGNLHENFMVCTPVEGLEGGQYAVMVVTPIVEFTRDVKRLETRTENVVASTRWAILIFLFITILAIGGIVAYYGAVITGKLKALTDAADRISTGEMETQITVKSDDEIGDLANAIIRMQESIRLSIDRLKRRRNR